MSNTNSDPDPIVTEIKAQNYIQHTVGDFTQDNEADLVSVKNDFYRTGKDTYNLTVYGKTELDYGYRSRTSNGNVEEDAEGNLMEKCQLSATRVFLGARNSVKIGPSFFTTAFSDTRMDLGTHLAVGTIGIGLGVARLLASIGATAEISGVRLIQGMTVIDHCVVFEGKQSVVEVEDVKKEVEMATDVPVGAATEAAATAGTAAATAAATTAAATAASVGAAPVALAASSISIADTMSIYSRIIKKPRGKTSTASTTKIDQG